MAEHYLDSNGHDVWYLYTRGWTRRAGNRPLTHKRLAALVGFFCRGPDQYWCCCGCSDLAGTDRLHHEINNQWLLALGGMVSIVLGVLLFIQPVAGGIAIIWTVAGFAMIFGVLLIALGFRLKNQNAPGSRQALRSA